MMRFLWRRKVEIIDRVHQLAIIPVVSIPKLEHALPLAESLIEGGLPCAEITFRPAEPMGGVK